eukprot:TRINITY_DN1988_c0_g1_i1.p2 TRINITY_DN1988_c0_g1~~TRINITY_DN1988_c0_g1_i1.p2  ORF type:complete len:692 (-),score=255.23 TRINITY_DN1988_c0_g1_i1:552-2627(-)
MAVDTHANDFARSLDKARSQGAVLAACIMLSVDSLNPIKVICGLLGVPTYFAAYPFALMLVYLLSSYLSELTYFGVRVFFTSILSIFFTKIDVIGHSNVPRDGPIIFTGNHANQFVDALQVMTNCGHKVGFLIAQRSWERPVVGFFARALGCIPVARPQDAAMKMPPAQTIRGKGNVIFGTNTSFKSQLRHKDKVRFRGHSEQLVVKEIVSDTELLMMDDVGEEHEALGESAWDLLRYVDQTRVFDGVHEALRMGQCLGIFPEGGSHDRTDLLPLKVGVAIIAFGVLEKHNIQVPIVPIGLSYFRGHRFRGRAVVEFGPPIRISPELQELYRTNRRQAYTTLLLQIEDSMRSCIVTAPDYNALRLVYTARRLYQPSHRIPTPELKQDMNRRFAEGYKILLRRYSKPGASAEAPSSPSRIDKGYTSDDDQHGTFPDENLPEDARMLKRHLEEYREKLQRLGLRDYQVPTLGQPDPLKATYTLLHLFLVALLAAIPSIVLNAPVGLVARKMAEAERKRALAGSVVKITARDVMMSKKIIISIVMVPTLWLAYALALFFWADWQTSTKVLAVLAMPVFSYAGVMATEAGMVDAKDLKPVLMRLRPEVRREMLALPALRARVQAELRAFVARVGPSLGDIYNNPQPLSWSTLMAHQPQSRSTTNLENMAKEAVAVMEGSAQPALVTERDTEDKTD